MGNLHGLDVSDTTQTLVALRKQCHAIKVVANTGSTALCLVRRWPQIKPLRLYACDRRRIQLLLHCLLMCPTYLHIPD